MSDGWGRVICVWGRKGGGGDRWWGRSSFPLKGGGRLIGKFLNQCVILQGNDVLIRGIVTTLTFMLIMAETDRSTVPFLFLFRGSGRGYDYTIIIGSRGGDLMHFFLLLRGVQLGGGVFVSDKVNVRAERVHLPLHLLVETSTKEHLIELWDGELWLNCCHAFEEESMEEEASYEQKLSMPFVIEEEAFLWRKGGGGIRPPSPTAMRWPFAV